MKRLLLTILPALFALTAFAQQDRNEVPYQTKTFTGKLTALRVETSGGGITVEGSSRTDVKVELYVKANNYRNTLSQAEIDERLKQYEIVMRTEGNTVIATAKNKNRDMDWKRSLNIAFRVYTPRQMATDLETSGGGIRLSHLTGRQAFTTSGGGLSLDDLDGDLKGRTSGGGIQLTDCHSKASGDRIDLETSGGGIEATNASGPIRLETSGGGIRLRNLTGKINAGTSGGSVSGDGITGELVTTTSGGGIRLMNVAGSLEATTSAGSVDLEMTKLGDYLRLSTSAGSVRVKMPLSSGMNLDVSGDRVSMPLTNFNGTSEKDRVKGKLNGGGIPVAISASSGSVSVNQ
ncbi:MAG: DUF4097 family beta strand repeat protein [Bacteroidetes bacterium]|nr:DUF4097 family beta strand repeat protein [Fibrella sp.]